MFRRISFCVFPDIPEKFHPDFIRGVLDGDGWVCSYIDKRGFRRITAGWLGTLKLINKIKEVLIKNCTLGDVKILPHHNMHRLKWGGPRQAKRIYKYLYYNKNVRCLERKRVNFIQEK